MALVFIYRNRSDVICFLLSIKTQSHIFGTPFSEYYSSDPCSPTRNLAITYYSRQHLVTNMHEHYQSENSYKTPI